MTNAELIERILKRLGNRTSSDLRTYAELEIVTKIDEYEQGPVLPWFLETESTPSTAAGVEIVSLPSDFLREVEDGALWIQTAEGVWKELGKLQLDRLRAGVAEEGNGLPEGYAIFGGNIHLGPIPDAIYNLKFSYYKKSPEFVDNTDETTYWCKHAPNLVIFGAATQIAAVHILNQDLATALSLLEDRARTTLYNACEARANANQRFDIED